jgi:hypothetical protein
VAKVTKMHATEQRTCAFCGSRWTGDGPDTSAYCYACSPSSGSDAWLESVRERYPVAWVRLRTARLLGVHAYHAYLHAVEPEAFVRWWLA